jgi:hypothetical protein
LFVGELMSYCVLCVCLRILMSYCVLCVCLCILMSYCVLCVCLRILMSTIKTTIYVNIHTKHNKT